MKRKEVFRHGKQAIVRSRRGSALDTWTLVWGFPGTATPIVDEKERLAFS